VQTFYICASCTYERRSRAEENIEEPCNFHTGQRARVSAACMDACLSSSRLFCSFSPDPFFFLSFPESPITQSLIYVYIYKMLYKAFENHTSSFPCDWWQFVREYELIYITHIYSYTYYT
ncbi:unnamed protein product, partial [Ixodes hexagonus]